ncbi:MAG: hypothetical protein ACYC6A_12470 [Armatimonadota bacterium]
MPKLILCAGMRRSGSTWLYNVLRYCYLNAGCRTYGDYAKEYDASVPADAHVVKVHPFNRELCGQAKHVFTTIRDLRDAVASMVRFKLAQNTPAGIAHAARTLITREYETWAPYSDMEIRYEEMVRDRPGTIAKVLRVLELPDVDPLEVQRDIEKLTRMALPARDRATQLWPRHLTDGRLGSYGDTLSPRLVEIVEDVAGDWLAEHGYTERHSSVVE